jgi:ketosteroid isomerase-like protein
MSLEQNKQTALKMLQAVGAHDAAAMAALMTADATWWVLGRGARETATPRGPFLESFPAAMARLFASPIRFTVQGVTAEGDRVAVEADSSAKLTNGKTYNNLYHFLFLFEGGKIKAVREYNDTAYMALSFS